MRLFFANTNFEIQELIRYCRFARLCNEGAFTLEHGKIGEPCETGIGELARRGKRKGPHVAPEPSPWSSITYSLFILWGDEGHYDRGLLRKPNSMTSLTGLVNWTNIKIVATLQRLTAFSSWNARGFVQQMHTLTWILKIGLGKYSFFLVGSTSRFLYFPVSLMPSPRVLLRTEGVRWTPVFSSWLHVHQCQPIFHICFFALAHLNRFMFGESRWASVSSLS